MKRNLKLKQQNNQYTLIAIFIIAIGFLVRVINFGEIPFGLNQDEAFAAYETYSLLNYGVDSAGNPFPTYFVSWGSGMNVLQSYLAIPFMWLFGYSEAVFRLPSLLCSIATLPVFFLLLKKLFNKKIALIGLSLLSISPWHVMLSRWGLESNLTPAFLLFGFFFLIKGTKKNAYFLLSALFYGLSLYAYSINWIIVPLILIVFGIYIITTTPKIKIGYLLVSCFILLIFALPHILFLMVNNGIIPEIKTAFITIPKMVYMRSEEISLLNIFNVNSWINLFRVLFLQVDSVKTNVIAPFGIFYHISSPFLIIGFISLLFKLKKDIKSKTFSGAYFILSGFAVCFFVALCISYVNVNKSNGLHLFTLSVIAFGIFSTINFVKHKKVTITAVLLAFAICFTSFCGYYFGIGKEKVSDCFSGELSKAVELVNEKNCQNIAADRSIYHSQILFYDKTSPQEFKNTVKYETTTVPYLKATSFGKYTFISEYNKLGNYDAYIFPHSHLYFFNKDDFEITVFKKYAVAIRLTR